MSSPHRSDRAVRLDLSGESINAIRQAFWRTFYDGRRQVKEYGRSVLDEYQLKDLRHRAYAYGEVRRALLRRRGHRVPRRTRALDFEGYYRPISRFPRLSLQCQTCSEDCYGPMHDIADDGPNLVHVCRKTPSPHHSSIRQESEVVA